MSDNKMEIENIDINLIDISKYNVRKTNAEEGLDELAESIKLIGLQQPIVVLKKDGRYDVLIGQRRYRAAKKIGLDKIPAIVKNIDNEKDAIIISFSENIHRVDLKYQDKMLFAQKLLSILESIKNVAMAIGVTEQTIRNYLGYSAVPEEIKNLVDEEKISASTAIRIIRNIDDKEKAIQIATKIQEIPRSRDRLKIIDFAKENPSMSVDQIIDTSSKINLKITIHLTPKVAEALKNASIDYKIEKEDITLEALKAWLNEKGYLI
jgi:ParB family chromosome partitioning protein